MSPLNFPPLAPGLGWGSVGGVNGGMGTNRVLGQSLPTVWILYFLCWNSLGEPRGYRETYVGQGVQLELSLEVNPEGWFQGPGDRVHFGGFFLREGEEIPVVGYRVRRGQSRYTVFEAEGQRFVGVTRASPCPSSLNYTWQGTVRESGTLRGGFCY